MATRLQKSVGPRLRYASLAMPCRQYHTHWLGRTEFDLSRVKMMLISVVVCEKKQRLEVARGFTVFTSKFYLLHTIPTQPVNHTMGCRLTVECSSMNQLDSWDWWGPGRGIVFTGFLQKNCAQSVSAVLRGTYSRIPIAQWAHVLYRSFGTKCTLPVWVCPNVWTRCAAGYTFRVHCITP
eukprot:COSAG02_NODE_1239_length_13713_cov_37.434259_13_plen_180_part_00